MDTLLESDQDIKEAHKVYKEFSQNSDYREMYEARLKWKRDHEGRIQYEVKKAKEETEKRTKLETARELVKLGTPVETISKATGLSIEEIESLTLK